MIELLKRYKRSIAFISDTHVGSLHAPWPEAVKLPTGQEISISAHQEYLNGCFFDYCKKCDEFEVDTVCMVGDMVHGNQRKNWGANTMSADLNIQVEAAIKMLRPLTNGRKVVGVSGSGYHDSLDTLLDKQVVEGLGGEYLGFLAHFPIAGTGRIVQMLHGTSAAMIYPEMIMARNALFQLSAEGSGNVPFHVDLRVQGHLHFFSELHNECQHILQLPGWTTWIPWKGSLQNYGKMVRRIGACIVLIDEADRIKVMPFLYDRPLISDGLREGI